MHRIFALQVFMKSSLLLVVLGLGGIVAITGCTHGSSYSYSYYTGKKNPRVKRDQPPQANSQARPVKGKTTSFHIVRRGETLYSIAWQYGHDVRDVARWNRIRAPYTIYPQQKISLIPTKSYSRPKKPVKSTGKKVAKSTPSRVKTKSKPTIYSQKIRWQWPTKGKIIGRYSARDSGKKGLDIAGRKGQRIYAAAGGQIVYSGSGLRGYGKLIIIKHNDTYFSAYAHNSRLFVREQQKVKKGQHIADMGSSEAQRVMLHFEVRRNGKPVDPLRYLPKRR